MTYVSKDTPWYLCAACTYCGAPEGFPCFDMNRRKSRTCKYPHITRHLCTVHSSPERTEVPKNPITPTQTERLTKLEAERMTERTQLRAALQAILELSESVAELKADNNYLTRVVQEHKDTVDKLFREQMLHKAVQLCMEYEPDSDEPTFEDYWDLDQSKTDLNLTYRVEEVIL